MSVNYSSTPERDKEWWNKAIREAPQRAPDDPFTDLICRTPIFEALIAMAHVHDDLTDVIEALREIKRYDLSDRLRVLRQRLDHPLTKVTLITSDPTR